jgi:hypothetical protein
VDEESLNQWFILTEQAEMTRYIQTVLAEDPSSEFGSMVTYFATHKDRVRLDNEEDEDLSVDSQIGSEFLFLSVFDRIFHAFATDRSFGLDAYLSRRIRHGTLSGHLMTPVNRVLKRLSDLAASRSGGQAPSELSGIETLVQQWREFLTKELDHIRTNVLQIRSTQHPDGLIQVNWRTGANIAHLDATIARVRNRVIETSGTYDIFSDIYSLCWDCLESDLAQLRRYMVRQFQPRAAGELTKLSSALTPDERFSSFALVQELHGTLLARIQDVCGWFIRPVFRRDEYSLKMLVMSTLSIVRELDAGYAFSEEVVVPNEMFLNRSAFDVFGDVLFVLIGNAARHGDLKGQIVVSAAKTSVDDGLVSLEVTSQVGTDEQFALAVLRIASAMDVEETAAIGQAAVEEGFSGLRKLTGLLQRFQSRNVTIEMIPDQNGRRIKFRLLLPSEVKLLRRRGLG